MSGAYHETMMRSGHNCFNSVMTCAVNSESLSLCRIAGAPNNKKISSNWYATSAARFEVRGLKHTEFSRIILVVHDPLIMSLTHRLHINQINLSTRTEVLWQDWFNNYAFGSRPLPLLLTPDARWVEDVEVMLAYFLLVSFIILSRPPWPVAIWATFDDFKRFFNWHEIDDISIIFTFTDELLNITTLKDS